MNKLIYFIILNILLIGSVYAEKNKFLNMAQSKVKQEMKDPDSTKFQNLREIKNSVGESVVCGEVNAKNSYGGVVSGNGKYSTLRIFTPTSFNDIQHGIFA